LRQTPNEIEVHHEAAVQCIYTRRIARGHRHHRAADRDPLAGALQGYYEGDVNATLADVYNSPGDGFLAINGQPGPAGDGSGKGGVGSGELFDKLRHPGRRMNIGFADGHVDGVVIAPGDLKQVSFTVDFPVN